jgi:hypothetical protein
MQTPHQTASQRWPSSSTLARSAVAIVEKAMDNAIGQVPTSTVQNHPPEDVAPRSIRYRMAAPSPTTRLNATFPRKYTEHPWKTKKSQNANEYAQLNEIPSVSQCTTAIHTYAPTPYV